MKGSGRSIEAYNMFEEMNKCRALFTKFGGHKLAAGLSLEEENVERFRRTINESVNLTEAGSEEQKSPLICSFHFAYVNEKSDSGTGACWSLLEREIQNRLFAEKNLKGIESRDYREESKRT